MRWLECETFTHHPARPTCKLPSESRDAPNGKGVILADEEVHQLTEAGCEIHPMKWVDTDKNTYDYHCGEKIAKLILFHFELIFAR